MKWLAIDIGNTQTVTGLYEIDRSAEHFRFSLIRRTRFRTHASITADEWRAQIPDHAEADRVAIASVVPALHSVISESLRHQPWLSIQASTPRPFELELPHPEQLGADRLANVRGALARYQPPFLIIDSGTATTFCLVDARRRYIGGAIVPGLETSFSALQAKAARLFSVELVRPEKSVGNTTELQLQSGLLHGTEALIEGLSDRLLRDAGPGFQEAHRLVTGGCAHFLKLSDCYEFLPDLTLEGLLHYLDDQERLEKP
ncbi:MAG: Type pantothenate kinase [Pseudomonadota bacterium]|jgi:type III pantothenate kinase